MSAEQARASHKIALQAEDLSPLGQVGSGHRAQNMTLRNLRRFLIGNRLNFIGLCLVMLFLFLSIFGSAVAPYDPTAKGDIINAKLVAPSSTYLLGTDEQGRGTPLGAVPRRLH